jgi:hypothetical protein
MFSILWADHLKFFRSNPGYSKKIGLNSGGTVISLIKNPPAFSLCPRQGSIIEDLHLAPYQDFPTDFCYNLLGQLIIVCVFRPWVPLHFNEHHVPSAFTLFEIYLEFAADSLKAAQNMIDLALIDIDGPVDEHVIGAAEDPVMPGKRRTAGTRTVHNSGNVTGAVANQRAALFA